MWKCVQVITSPYVAMESINLLKKLLYDIQGHLLMSISHPSVVEGRGMDTLWSRIFSVPKRS